MLRILGIFENFEPEKKKDSITVVPSCQPVGGGWAVGAKGPGLGRDRCGHTVVSSEFTKHVSGCSL